jgi:hypothetical protein
MLTLVSDVATQAPLALLGALFSVPGGASATLAMTKAVGRNWPLAVLVALIGTLFVPTAADETATEVGVRPNGFRLSQTVRPIASASGEE